MSAKNRHQHKLFLWGFRSFIGLKTLARISSLLAPLLVACNQNTDTKPTPNSSNNKIDSNQIDTSRFAILNHDSIRYKIFENGHATSLSQHDLREIERLLKECIDEYNEKQEVFFKERKFQNPEISINLNDFIIDLKNYQRQYVAVKNEKGEKEVWVNCFCGSGTIPRKNPVDVCDGGKCYFNLKINLTTRHHYELMVNGYA